jgi:carbon storage regulator
MRILKRKPGQAFRIGPNVTVRILHSDGGQVRLAVQAPRQLDVTAEETYAAVSDANRAAVLETPAALTAAAALVPAYSTVPAGTKNKTVH